MSPIEIDTCKRYKFPNAITVVEYIDKYLVIAPEYANWIVLESAYQLSVFDYLKEGHTIRDTVKAFNEEDVELVVCQIEARKFCNKKICSIVETERSMHLYLTNKCNLLCPHCYMYSGLRGQDELTTEQLMMLLYNYKTIANGVNLTISGGEPTSRADCISIIKYASELGLNVKLLTNGVLLSVMDIDEISKYIYSVQISIDGFSEESNAIIRGKRHFQKALDSTDAFIRNGVKTSVAITPTYSILKQYANDYVVFAKQLVHKYADKKFCVKFTEKLSVGREVNLSKIENEEYTNLVRSIQTEIYGYEQDFIQFVQTMSKNIIIDNCMFGVFAVASNGDVYLCPEIGKLHPVANVKNDSFIDILQKAIEAEEATLVSRLRPCKNCELRYICGGGCRIEEFPNVTEIKSFKGVKNGDILSRRCSYKMKEKFYDLMIKSNEYLYEI